MSAIPRHDLDEVVTKADLRTELAGLCSEVRTGLASLETKLEAQQAALYKHQNRLVIAVLLSIVGSLLGVGLLT